MRIRCTRRTVAAMLTGIVSIVVIAVATRITTTLLHRQRDYEHPIGI